MSNPDNQFVVIGKIGAPYGVKGWLKITSFTESIPDILDYAPWYLENQQDWTEIEVDEGREYGKGVIIHIVGYDSPEAARVLTGKTIAVKRSQLPVLEKNEYYWSDLEGLTVINQRGETLGKVIYIMETGANDVLVIKGEKEHAIPYLPGSTITSIDLAKKEMHVDWDLI